MSWCYRRILRPLLFRVDSERIHDFTLRTLGCLSRSAPLLRLVSGFTDVPELPVEVFGLQFPNPVGLAAGMDKRAAAVPIWAALGFGFSELGGVTWHAQPGNPKPRMFRAVPDEALINRMGFNNGGAEAMAATLAAWRHGGLWPAHPVGINLGKSKVTPNEKAVEDYARSFRALWPQADFFVVNVSSPNTPNLRALQDKAALDEILAALQEINRELSVVSGQWSLEAEATRSGRSADGHLRSAPQPPVPIGKSAGSLRAKPILVKVAPDLSFEALDEIVALAGPRNLAGIVATNTTITRPDTADERCRRAYTEAGGLSGRPLRPRSTEVIRHLFRQTSGRLPLIGVGGIFTADDAWEKITAGASLLQVYTGLVYEGPGIVRHLVLGLQRKLEQRGLRSLAEAVGSEARTD
jgi:dihydroorotate dehydrogenase